jgi:hypothetical protein
MRTPLPGEPGVDAGIGRLAAVTLAGVGAVMAGNAGAATSLPLLSAIEAPNPELIKRWNDSAVVLYEANKVEAAMILFLKAAEAGDRSALYNAASIRIRGETRQPRLARAVMMLEASAAKGFAPAQYSYAYLLDRGEIVHQDLPKAQQWYERAAEQGHADAAEATATGYYLGRGVAQATLGRNTCWPQCTRPGSACRSISVAPCIGTSKRPARATSRRNSSRAKSPGESRPARRAEGNATSLR